MVPGGGVEAIRSRGLAGFRAEVGDVTGLGFERAREIADWDAVKVLDVRVDRLRRWWRPGFLAIGDAAHAMSPIGGVGVNLAVQDAVAAANILHAPLRAGAVGIRDLERVQARREAPVRALQWVQVQAQNRVLQPVMEGAARGAPLPFRLLARFPWLQRFPARAIGLGLRLEVLSEAMR
ncbi:FAD-dependent monooxygenase [Frigidibacter sp. ROC022]|uniref:FAD-dependent monooxygenase n=1 Tax=Frigidibacter sp. ROC022 TaxID=2971796 RepID=UPI0023DF6ABC|nr:FAD-dependent monooxygenase [Frigidibacter sp. ROC022]